MDKHSTIIRGIDLKTWQAFRLLCLKKGKSANQKIKELINEFVRKGEK